MWCDTLNVTEFDVVKVADGCAVNRYACVETHLFHDRLMRIGGNDFGAGSAPRCHGEHRTKRAMARRQSADQLDDYPGCHGGMGQSTAAEAGERRGA